MGGCFCKHTHTELCFTLVLWEGPPHPRVGVGGPSPLEEVSLFPCSLTA